MAQISVIQQNFFLGMSRLVTHVPGPGTGCICSTQCTLTTWLLVRRDTAAGSQLANVPEAPATVSRPLEHLDHLLVLRRFYRNCIRAEVYHRSTASAYTPYTDEELQEQFVSDVDRDEAVDARKEEAMRILIDMQVISDQITVRTTDCASQCNEARLTPEESVPTVRCCAKFQRSVVDWHRTHTIPTLSHA